VTRLPDEEGSSHIDGIDDLLEGVFESQDETFLKEKEDKIKKEYESLLSAHKSERVVLEKQEQERIEIERHKKEEEEEAYEEANRLKKSKELWIGFFGFLAIIGVTYTIYRFFSPVWAVVFFLAVSLMIEKRFFAINVVILVIYWLFFR